MKLRSELGGAAYTERVQRLRDERDSEKQAEAAALQGAIDAVHAKLNALPTCDFTDMEMRTKAFRRVKILRQEENQLKFEVNGIKKTFALPACIAQGFLIPDEPAVITAFQRRQGRKKSSNLCKRMDFRNKSCARQWQFRVKG